LAEEREACRRADTLLAGLMYRMHRSILCYSPECVEKVNSAKFTVAISAPYTPALEVVSGPMPLLELRSKGV
jgi:hypothetical protein